MKFGLTTALVSLSACSLAPLATPPASMTDSCKVSADDQAWIDSALVAWRLSADEMTRIGNVTDFQAVFFDAGCVLTSTNALSSARPGDAIWIAAPHSGKIKLPDGGEMPASITSFTSATDDLTFFVMSTPSVWREGGVDGGPLGLETLMVAVLLHEGSHVAQANSYGVQISALAERNRLPDNFDDDTMQTQFEGEPAFAESVARETGLFLQAAAATDLDAARQLASEARSLMRERAARYFVGEDAYWSEAEDLWLTFEGAGQWAGYAWLADPHGAAATEETAMPGFGQRSRWWSQKEGLAIVLALDRISPDSWKPSLYGDGEMTLLQLLDAALSED